MAKFLPSRTELKWRLVISLFMCALLAVAFMVKGPKGLVGIELFLFGGMFAGGSALWCIWHLSRRADD